ncbi:D-serine ammonia-lyase [Mycoplasmatota bacterium]|nr:D-serine ammonia-lyase [Mycoplasmatota bacterium]
MNYSKKYPLLKSISDLKEILWINPNYQPYDEANKRIELTYFDVLDAESRLNRFSSYIMSVYPETKNNNGLIESEIKTIPNMKNTLKDNYHQEIQGSLFLKCDHNLPISGSIKARGGIYEVLKHAEQLAIDNNLLTIHDDYSIMNSSKFKSFFSQYSIAVGSTGNLGLSIGIIGSQLGFKVIVHMSKDAKEWKKELLRNLGVKVIEYEADYSEAVKAGRKLSENNPYMHFIDDENSKDLFLGYSVAALRLKKQLDKSNIKVDKDHPLFVYLPCGVGGGPGGVTFGLKLIFKDNVHCFFAEPTHSPCMLLGLMTGMHDLISVGDFGIDNKTDADGLAVGKPSGFVGKTLENLISGVYTVSDESLYHLLKLMVDLEDIKLEPSALAGIPLIFNTEEYKNYLMKNDLKDKMKQSTHLSWATGGSMVPESVMKDYYNK